MNIRSKKVVVIAVIAAFYVVLTLLSSFFGLAYGPIQFRLSEALIIFAAFSYDAVIGLTLGCMLSNIASPYGIVDILVGTLATFLAAFLLKLVSSKVKSVAMKCLFATVFQALFNGTLVGIEIAMLTASGSPLSMFAVSFIQIAIGEIAVCGLLCWPIYMLIRKNRELNRFFINTEGV